MATPPPHTAPDAPPAAAETQRAYRADWPAFQAWCDAAGLAALPAAPATMVGFLAAIPTLSAGTLARRAAAIAARHRQTGLVPPTVDPAVTTLLRAARRQGVRRRAPRPRPAQLARMAASCPRDLAGLRDRALLLLAGVQLTVRDAPLADPASARRARLTRVDLVGLTVEQLRFSPAGVALFLYDAGPVTAAPCAITVPVSDLPGRCPVRALQAWLQASDTHFGAVFRKVDRWGNVEHRPLGTDAVRRILARRTPRRVRRRERILA